MEASGTRETLVSLVLFSGDRVFKFRKPVKFPFLDLSTPEAREVDCHREIALNRRLAPDVYLGVAQLSLDGRVLDHAVAMRRLSDEQRLASVLRFRTDCGPKLREIAGVLATFHAGAERSPEISAAASSERLRALWGEEAAELAPYVGNVLDRTSHEQVLELAGRWLAGHGALLEARIAGGFICDGHGDLQADDIFCCDDGPRILDCLEFDDRLRWGDVVADIAFLAMDLERLQHPEAARELVEAYEEASGHQIPRSLLAYYVAQRAYVRCKVACLRHTQGDREAAREADLLLALAHERLEQAQERVVLVGGLPGTGKSTLAAQMAESLGGTLLSSDQVRKEHAGIAPDAPAPSGFREGLYRPEVTTAVYRQLAERARAEVALGRPVVVDASFVDESHREQFRQLAKETGSSLVEIACVTPPQTAAERIRRRLGAGDRRSDATAEIAAALARVADPWPSAATIDTSGDAQASLSRALVLVSPRNGWH